MADRCATPEEIIAIGGPSFGPPPAPGLVPEAVLEFFAGIACDLVGDCFGDQTSRAHILLTLHMLAIWQGTGAEQGPVASRTINKISESYATSAPTDAELGSTKWGRLYLAMDAARVPLPFTVGPGPLIGTGGGGCGC